MVDASLQFFAFRLSFSSSPSAIVLVSPLHSILFFSVHTCSLLFASLRSLTNTQTTTRKLVCSGHNSIHKLHRTVFFSTVKYVHTFSNYCLWKLRTFFGVFFFYFVSKIQMHDSNICFKPFFHAFKWWKLHTSSLFFHMRSHWNSTLWSIGNE